MGTVKVITVPNCERLIHFQTWVPAVPSPVTTSLSPANPIEARLLNESQSAFVVGDLLPKPLPTKKLSSLPPPGPTHART